MKEEIFRLLKQAYSQLGLGDAFLMARAEMLDSLGFVTSENVGDVVAKQKSSLEAAQRANDTRVTEAIKKHEEEAKKKAEEDAKKAKEEADKKKAEEEAKKAAEEARKKAEEEAKKSGGLSPELKAYLEELEKKRSADFNALLDAQKQKYEETIKGLNDSVKALKDENAAAAVQKAKAERNAKILNKAKELGIPQSRIDEGFVIADDADDAAISAYLGTVKKNINAQKLPNSDRLQMGEGNATKEDVDNIADGLLGK